MTTQPSAQDVPNDGPTCRMLRWFHDRHDAERELLRRLEDGWIGSLHDCAGIWRVDVIRPLRNAT